MPIPGRLCALVVAAGVVCPGAVSSADPGSGAPGHGPTLAVRVVDAVGSPIAGARVSQDPVRITDADGRVNLVTEPDLGNDQFFVTADGYASRAVEVFLEPDRGAIIEVRVALAPGVGRSGVVVDEHDRPVPGAEVDARSGAPHWVESVRADAHGRWELVDYAAHTSVALEASTPCATPDSTMTIDAAVHPDDDVVLRVEPAANVDGIAVDGSGHPLAHVHVHVSSATSSDIETGSDGRFPATCVRGDEVEINANTDTLGPSPRPSPCRGAATSRSGWRWSRPRSPAS